MFWISKILNTGGFEEEPNKDYKVVTVDQDNSIRKAIYLLMQFHNK